jgi:hypothetical protein
LKEKESTIPDSFILFVMAVASITGALVIAFRKVSARMGRDGLFCAHKIRGFRWLSTTNNDRVKDIRIVKVR